MSAFYRGRCSDTRYPLSFLYSVLAAFRNAQKGRCLRAAWPDPVVRSANARGEHGATCSGWKRRLGRVGSAPVRAWAQRPLLPAGVRGSGPPAAPAYVCERMGGLGPHAACQEDGARADPINCFWLPAVLCGAEIPEVI
ncbi:hypothetical protein HispidOSU_006217 [Sigmodon hispidus]